MSGIDVTAREAQLRKRLEELDSLEAANEEEERLRIAAALQRIEEDEYGWCAQCGEEIVSKRLDVDPMAVMCSGCAR